ncbi:MAG: Ku protein, partial [Acidimicrobiia bacterium]
MPRSIWKGAISFGLVTIPVALYTATESKTPKFKMLRGTDHSPIKYKRVAESDGEEVVWDDIVRGYEVEKGKYVVFTDEELEAATAADGNRLVDVVQFVDESEIDPIYYKSSYYLAPERTGVKAYKILLEALKDKGRVGLAKVAIRDKQQLATLRAKDGVLVMETMYWPDE